MKLEVEVQQGTDAWRMARIGIPTASQFALLMPKRGKIGATGRSYATSIVAERILGRPIRTAETKDMARGTALEMQASLAYAFEHPDNGELQESGFILSPDGRCGASPDRLVGDSGLLEIKCPSIGVHMDYLLNGFGEDYYAQAQVQLYVTGRDWNDRYSYHPDAPQNHVERCYRDEAFIRRLRDAIEEFHGLLDELTETAKRKGLL